MKEFEFRVIKEDQQLVSNWSGGKTRELAIFPEESRYLDRDFLWRLSTANSDREESSFTRLENYDRILMVLEGDVVLAHGNQRSIHLQSLEQDSFDGAVKTRCYGKLLRDYNLIYAKGCQARMDLICPRSKAQPIRMSAAATDSGTSYGIFCLDGYAVISCGEESEMIRPGQQAVIDFPAGAGCNVLLMGEGRCILTEIVMDGGSDRDAAEDPSAPPAKAGQDVGASGTGVGTSTAFADYRTALKLYFGRNRWAMAMRREGKARVYYDRAMSQALKKLERWYIAEGIWILGVLACCLVAFRGGDARTGLMAAVIFTAVHLLGIVPALYMVFLPRPFGAHMKPVEEMNAAERAYHQEEISEDPRLEKLMNKYRSDDENYFADESSPLYRLARRRKE